MSRPLAHLNLELDGRMTVSLYILYQRNLLAHHRDTPQLDELMVVLDDIYAHAVA